MAKPSNEAKQIAKTLAKHDPAKDSFRSPAQAIVRRFQVVGEFFPDFANVLDAGVWAASTGRMSAEQGRKLLDLSMAGFVQVVLDIEASGVGCAQDRANAWMAA